MNVVFGAAAPVILVVLIPFIVRVIEGPTIFDRVVGLNGGGTLVPVLMVMIGFFYERVDMFVDLAIALYLLNLFTTLLIARYVRDHAEAEEVER
ncbi:MAG: monovalent cation/H+ antiporter complex subunit F [Gemmatimonadota bacterium]